MESKDLSPLVTQLEYYLSDANLEFDEFFFTEIEKSADRWLAIDQVMNCNKVKKGGWTICDLQNALIKSELLELNEDETCMRRKATEMPEFKGTRKEKFEMRTRSDSKKLKDEELKKDDTEDKSKYFVPVLLVIPDVSGLPKNGKLIEDTIGKEYEVKVPYARINKMNGHIVFDKNDTDPKLLENLLKNGFHFETNKIEVISASEREINFFNRENLAYQDKIVKKKFNKSVKKAGKAADRKLFNSVIFAGKKYNNFSSLQTEFKNLISKTRNGAEIEGDQIELLKELLKHHEKSEEKLKDLTGFTVDFHPTYKQTRCFFIIKNDGTKEDFSLHKCLNVLKEQVINE